MSETRSAPGPAPSRLETLGTLRMANLDMAFATAFVTLTTGVFLVGFVQTLSKSALWVNALAAIPSLCGILQIPGAIYGRGFPSYRPIIARAGWVWRFFYLPLIALPLLPIPVEAKLLILVLCVALGSAAVVSMNPVYNDWLAELVPSNSRGFFFGRRNAIATAVGAAVGILGALLLDGFRTADQQDTGFSVIFALASVCGGISMFFFMKMRDIDRPNPIRQSVGEGMRAIAVPFGDRDFRKVLTFLVLAGFGQAFAGNLFAAFALESLELNYKVIQGTAVFHAVGSIAAVRLWGYVSDKYGNRPVLMLLSALICLNPIPWMLCFPGKDLQNSVILLGTHVLMGVIWSGVALCQFNLLLATAKPEDRGNYIAAGLTVSSLIGGIAPLLGAALYTTFNNFMPDVAAYKWVFATVIVLRIIAVTSLRPVKEEGASDLAHTMRVLGSMSPRGFRAMRDLARGGDVASREAAIQSVADENMGLASDEIIKALHDPSPRVRRQAASALARLNDPRAVGELVHQLEEHPDLVEEETVEALAVLGESAAVPALIRTLQSPRSVLRRASAKALGRIGSPDSIEALRVAAAETGDPDVRRASLQALRVLEATQAEPEIVAALMDPHPSVRIAAAEAVAELNLSSAVDALRESLLRFTDEASAEVAYALGVVGDRPDLGLILDEARASTSMITRRRCLLGVARHLGVEQDAYRLLLLDGMERDTALMERARSEARRNPEVQNALDLFAAGDESGALAALARAWQLPELLDLSEKPVAELFLVALLLGTQR